MHKCIFMILLAAVAGSLAPEAAAAYPARSIHFNNRLPWGDEKITLPDGTGPGAGFTAQMFRVQDDGSLQPLWPSTVFRSTSAPAAFFVEAVAVGFPDVLFEEGNLAPVPIKLRVRAWEGADWATARVRGESETYDFQLEVAWTATIVPKPDALMEFFHGFALHERPLLKAVAATGGGLKLQLSAEFGLTAAAVQVEQSFDLARWEGMGDAPIVNGEVMLPAAVASAGPRKYFRVKLP